MDEMLHKIILIIFVGFLFPFIQQQICDDNSDQQQQRLWSTLFCSDMYLLFRILIHIIQAFLIDGDVHKPKTVYSCNIMSVWMRQMEAKFVQIP